MTADAAWCERKTCAAHDHCPQLEAMTLLPSRKPGCLEMDSSSVYGAQTAGCQCHEELNQTRSAYFLTSSLQS